jgi:hypothetical protein
MPRPITDARRVLWFALLMSAAAIPAAVVSLEREHAGRAGAAEQRVGMSVVAPVAGAVRVVAISPEAAHRANDIHVRRQGLGAGEHPMIYVPPGDFAMPEVRFPVTEEERSAWRRFDFDGMDVYIVALPLRR